jgi:hypothetical protein
MRWKSRQHWFLAQLFQFQASTKLSYGLKTGAFNVPLRLAQGRSSTDMRSGSLPIHWTTNMAMIQWCQALTLSCNQRPEVLRVWPNDNRP